MTLAKEKTEKGKKDKSLERIDCGKGIHREHICADPLKIYLMIKYSSRWGCLKNLFIDILKNEITKNCLLYAPKGRLFALFRLTDRVNLLDIPNERETKTHSNPIEPNLNDGNPVK
ncbi:MAG: hypothetical protein D6748_05775 [Calditrichaeota bacterium]|nr:MAG: hypothetical protein D6748_05775 [Calditrichota bacterium]